MRPRTLRSAAEAGDLEALRYHLSRGADVNATTAAGHFALGGAIINRHFQVVEYLIANGADINQVSESGWSPLYLAAWAGCVHSTALLLLAGAKINTRTTGGWNSPSGYTPLHIAAERGQLAIVMLLVAAGAQVGARNGSSKTALDLAIAAGHSAIVQFLQNCAASGSRRKKPALPRRVGGSYGRTLS
jgi:ankyrin repeat protein